jgi:hypothetical protein
MSYGTLQRHLFFLIRLRNAWMAFRSSSIVLEATNYSILLKLLLSLLSLNSILVRPTIKQQGFWVPDITSQSFISFPSHSELFWTYLYFIPQRCFQGTCGETKRYTHPNLYAFILCTSYKEPILILKYPEAFDVCMNTRIIKLVTSIMFLDIIHRLVHFLKNTTFRTLDSVSVLR